MFRLKNGVNIICDPVQGAQSVALGVWVRAGSLDEEPVEAGIAHLAEHMAFKGTRSRSAREIAIGVEDRGASLDAATSHQRTGYYGRCLSGDVEFMTELIADVILNPVFDADELEREKNVVLQEISEAADDPADQVFEALAQTAWGMHPLGQPILGSANAVRSHDRARLIGFLNRHYRPDQTVIAISGGVDPERFLPLAEEHFGQMQTRHPQLPLRGKPIFQGHTKSINKSTEQVHVALAFPGVDNQTSQQFTARLLADIWGGGMSSRLFQRVREEKGLAYTVYAFADIFDHAGLIGAYFCTDSSQVIDAFQTTLDELKDMASAVSPEELCRAKAVARANLVMAHESFALRAEAASGQMMTYGHLWPTSQIMDAIDVVSANDISVMAQKMLATPQAALAIVGPNAPAIELELRTSVLGQHKRS